MVHQVVDTALQLHGALGYSHDTPLARWYTGIRSQRLVDGPDEVHRWRTGANVIKPMKSMAPRLRPVAANCSTEALSLPARLFAKPLRLDSAGRGHMPIALPHIPM